MKKKQNSKQDDLQHIPFKLKEQKQNSKRDDLE
jgi:hypothetical protein